jgi:hypothetical protein
VLFRSRLFFGCWLSAIYCCMSLVRETLEVWYLSSVCRGSTFLGQEKPALLRNQKGVYGQTAWDVVIPHVVEGW